jgi:transposase
MVVQRWTVEEKRMVVAEYESAPWGAKGAVLRRYGASPRQVRLWASYRDAGVLESGLRKGWQGRMTPRSESAEIGRLRAEVKRLEAELVQAHKDRWMAEAAAEALGKASALLQVMLESAESQNQPEGSSPSVSPS